MNNKETELQVTVVPNIYIDVVIGGRKQVYEVATAEMLLNELTRALNLLDQQGVEKTHRKSQLPPRRDLGEKTDDVGQLVGVAASRQEA